MTRLAIPASGLLVLGLAAGCGSSQKIFTITSYPQGATIFVDNQPRGQTDMEKLLVSFAAKPQAIVRLEKEGYQPTGTVLKMESEGVQFFALSESPNNAKTLEALNNIQRDLERFMTQLSELVKKNAAGKEP